MISYAFCKERCLISETKIRLNPFQIIYLMILFMCLGKVELY